MIWGFRPRQTRTTLAPRPRMPAKSQHHARAGSKVAPEAPQGTNTRGRNLASAAQPRGAPAVPPPGQPCRPLQRVVEVERSLLGKAKRMWCRSRREARVVGERDGRTGVEQSSERKLSSRVGVSANRCLTWLIRTHSGSGAGGDPEAAARPAAKGSPDHGIRQPPPEMWAWRGRCAGMARAWRGQGAGFWFWQREYMAPTSSGAGMASISSGCEKGSNQFGV
eukprot:gene9674-biopygen13791